MQTQMVDSPKCISCMTHIISAAEDIFGPPAAAAKAGAAAAPEEKA